MKSIFLFLGLAFFIYSCKDSIVDSNNQQGDYILEGSVQYYDPNYKIVGFFLLGEQWGFGFDTIKPDGSFRFVIPVPPDSLLRNIVTLYGFDGFNISDTNARVSRPLWLLMNHQTIYGAGGRLGRDNAPNTYNNQFEGFTFSEYAYTDRTVSINGTNFNISGNDTLVRKINLLAGKGWNRFNSKLVKQRSNYREYEISSVDPPNMTWKIYTF